jgi:hypothetical protein
MKNTLKALAFLSIFFLSVSCSKEDNNEYVMKGLVSFSNDPVYSQAKITFKAQIQFPGSGQPVNIDYLVLADNVVRASETVIADFNPDGMGIWFETGLISTSISQTEYSGKYITIQLDPDNKITSSEYTSEIYINLYKKATVQIP